MHKEQYLSVLSNAGDGSITYYVAEKLAESGVCGVKGELFHRKDIGTKKLIGLRIKNMKDLAIFLLIF